MSKTSHSKLDNLVSNARKRLGLPDNIDRRHFATVLDVFDDAIARFPDAPAFTCMGSTITYEELDHLASAFCAWLQRETSLKPGDRIAIQLPNILQYPVALYGAMKAGLVVVNTNPMYSARELEHQFHDADVKAVVMVSNAASKAAPIIEKLDIPHVIITEVGDLLSLVKGAIVNFVVKWSVEDYDLPRAVSFTDVLDKGQSLKPKKHQSSPDDIAVLQYTGGTTGVAKGAMLSHDNLLANMLQARVMFEQCGLEEASEVLVCPLPLYHIYAFMVSFTMLASGNRCILIPDPRKPDMFTDAMKGEQCTAFIGLNTLFLALAAYPDFQQLDFSRMKLTISGGMALTEDVAIKWKAVTKTDIAEGYGLTETSPVVSVNLTTAMRPGTVGVAVPGTQLMIIDSEGNELDVNQAGELCVRGPQVMQGYWQRKEATDKVLSYEGWLKTGDVAIVDDHGYIRIVDRNKDMIIVSGFNVYPNELENVASLFPAVLECAAIGLPDEVSGERVCLYVVTDKTVEFNEADLKAFCRERLAAYKIPSEIRLIDELPKSNVGKILRRELREIAKNS